MGRLGQLLPLQQLLLFSAVATSAMQIYQLWLMFGLAGTAQLLPGRNILALIFSLSSLSHLSLISLISLISRFLSFSNKATIPSISASHYLEARVPRGEVVVRHAPSIPARTNT